MYCRLRGRMVCNRLLLLLYFYMWKLSTTMVTSVSETAPLQVSTETAETDLDSKFRCEKQASDGSFHCSFTFLPKGPTEDELASSATSVPIHTLNLHYCDADTGECFSGHIQVTNQPRGDDPRRIDSNVASVVHVGERVYHSPFSEYGSTLERHLLLRRSQYENPLDEADWLIELGMSHRLVWDELQGYDTNAPGTLEGNRRQSTSSAPGTRAGNADADVESQYIEPAVNAFKQAIRILNRVISDSDTLREEKAEATLDLAYAFFQISDAYSARESPEKSSMALEYLKKSEKLYRRVLDQSLSSLPLLDSMSIRNAMLTRALILVRLGIHLLDETPTQQQIAAASGADSFARGGMIAGRDVADTLLMTQAQEEKLNPQLENEMLQQYQQSVNQAAMAEGYFREATALYERLLKDDPVRGSDKSASHRIPHDYAIALQNIATAANLQGEYEASLAAAELSLQQYAQALERWAENHGDPKIYFGIDPDVTDVITAMADIMLQVSDYHLKLGRYESSKKSYRESLQFYETHGVQPPINAAVLNDDSTIETYEQALQQYQVLKQDRTVDPADSEGEDSVLFVEQEVGYEGDLHMSLGSLYMSHGDSFQAISHLTQAMQLYERGGEHDKALLADVKFTLAEVYFKNGEYEDSVRLHAEALDLYQKIHGEGTNPLDLGVPDIKPTVVFQLDATTDDIESNPLKTVRSVANAPGSLSSSGSNPETTEGKRGEDPIGALVDYWYAAIANESEKEAGNVEPKPMDQLDEL